MSNFYHDNADLKFYVEKAIAWEPLVELTEFFYRPSDSIEDAKEALDFYQSVLELVGGFSAEEIAPHAADIDRQHHTLEGGEVRVPPLMAEIFEKIKALELHGMCIPRDLGGMNCPFILFMMGNELLSRADVSVAAHHGFHGGMAMAMLLYSTMEGSTTFDVGKARITGTRFSEAITEIISGEAWGSMDITEPGAGSDMAALRTKAFQDEEGQWRVSGQKIFITSGHARYHFVIARTEKPKGDDAFAGLQGLSMFLVPAFSVVGQGEKVFHASFDALEEKLGHHGSATVSINFDESPAHLLGRRGDGFKLMLQLMNNARVGVGFEALGICEAAYRLAADYAAERPSMGKMIDRHEMIADYLEEMSTDIMGIRALAVNGAYHEEMAQKLDLMLKFMPPDGESELKEIQGRLKRHRSTSRRLTPLLKYLAAEKAVEISRRSLQIHGGYGYSSEFGAEKLLRDAMVLPIYEGTSQIQALMAMKDNLMGILKDPKGFLKRNARAHWLGRSSRCPLERRVARLQARSYRTLQFLMARLAGKKIAQLPQQPLREWKAFFSQWDPKKDFALAMLHAERLTRMLADVAICELLLEQTRQFPEREEVLLSYLDRAEPRCRFLHDEITTTGKRLLAKLEPGTHVKMGTDSY